MVRFIRVTFFFLCLNTLAFSAPLQYLTKSLVTSTAFESATTNWNAVDDASIQISIGFSFPFNGTSYTQVWINSNGMLSFNSNNVDYNNLTLPYTSEAQSIYPYWDDMNRVSGGTIKYSTLGSAPNRHLVISWENVPHYPDTGSYSFQVVLYENGDIRFRYLSGSSANGASATIGVQENTTNYDQHSYNATINQNQDILYTINAITVPGTTPTCTTPIAQIGLSTYNTSGYGTYPNNASQYQTLINNYATTANLFGSGYVGQINGSGNPYGSSDNYLSIFDGYLYFPSSGVYKFGIDGDDAVEVYIDDILITGWYGGHGSAGTATNIVYVNASQGWHKVQFHHQERTGGDNYYLYWQIPGTNSLVIVPVSAYYHCVLAPTITKSSCVIHDGINSDANAKRIPGATIRYAFEVKNIVGSNIGNVIVNDTLNTNFDYTTIKNLQIQNGACNCLGVSSASNNPAPGTGNGVNPVKLNFATVNAGATECGYFEVNIK